MIMWKKEYSIGIESIDAQHQQLVNIINELKDGIDNKKENEVLKETLPKLVEYSKIHFHDEEKQMEMAGYTDIHLHKAQHKILINQIIQVLEQLKSGKTNVSISLFDFLKNWLLKHVLDHDKEFGYFVNEKR